MCFCVFVCLCVCVYVRVSVCVSVNIIGQVRECECALHTVVYTYIHVYIHTCIQTHTLIPASPDLNGDAVKSHFFLKIRGNKNAFL